LFRDHPQSPLPVSERPSFEGLLYWPFDPRARVSARFVPVSGETSQMATGAVDFQPIGQLEFVYAGQPLTLAAFWIAGYAGGLFVPFVDSTSGHETYGGGRYLLDTIKSADFGSDMAADQVVLDFNYAYHPSCAYDPRWVCPLAPPDSRLAIPIRAGEQSR
jgi:uncharacterized protein